MQTGSNERRLSRVRWRISLGAFIMACCPTICAATYAATPADLIVMEARVLTVDSSRPVAEAIAVRDGRFVAVGDTRDVEGLIGPATQVWRLPGKTITPGFNDAHLHPSPAYAAASCVRICWTGSRRIRW